MKVVQFTPIQRTWTSFLVSLYLLLFLMGCLPENNPVVVTRATLQATVTRPATLTPSPTVTITTPAPTMTATPAATNIPPTMETPTVTASPTSAGWLITDWSNFLLREEGYKIYLLRPGQTSQFITPGQLWYGQPWSPDGKKFIFDSSPSHQTNPPPELTMADLSTGQISMITLLHRPFDFYWSPNGKYLLYAASGLDHAIQIVLYDFEEQENKVLAEIVRERAGFFYLVGWSPDGRKIAYVSELNDQIDLFVLDVESLAIQQLTNTPDIETLAVWSTTDDRLLFGTRGNDEYPFETFPPGAWTLYLVDDTGANLMTLFSSFYSSPAWSPNGEKIAFSDRGQICILDIETLSEVCPLEDTPPYNDYSATTYEPHAWSADGNWLAFRATGHQEELCYWTYILELSTNTVTPADRGSCVAGPIYWSRAMP